MAMDTEPPGFDPHRWWNSATYTITANVFEQLLSLDPGSGELQPGLVADLPTVDEGATRYTFRLRHDVRFHDGRPLTAADVKFSLERLADPETQAEAASLYTCLAITGMADFVQQRTGSISGISVEDVHTLTIDLDHPDSALLPQLAYPAAAIVPARSRCRATDVNSTPVGTGPYRVTDQRAGEWVRLERFDGYWGPPPPIAAVSIGFNTEQSVSVERILSGNQDFMYEPLAPADFAALEAGQRAGSARLFRTPENCCYFLVLSQRHPALRSLRSRRAVAAAIDKRRLVAALGGLGHPADGGLFSPMSPYFQQRLAHPHDRARARAELAAECHEHPPQLTLLSSDLTPEREMSRCLLEDLRECGLAPSLKTLDYAAKAALTATRPPYVMQCDWHLSVPHGAFLMDPGFSHDGSANYADWSDPRFDALARSAHLTVDAAEQADLYRKMDRMVVADHVVWVPLIYSERVDLVGPRVHGFVPSTYPSQLIKQFSRYRLCPAAAARR